MNAVVMSRPAPRRRTLFLALLVALAALLAPAIADSTLHAGLVPVAQADGPQRDGGG